MEPPKQLGDFSFQRKRKSEAISSADVDLLLRMISQDLPAPLATIQDTCQKLTMACSRLNELFEEETLSDYARGPLGPLVAEDIPEAVRCIQGEVDHARCITSGLLQFIRLGQIGLQWEGLDVNQLVMGIVTSMERKLKSKEVVVRIEDLPDCMGDEVLVTQVFSILIDNAQKYLDPARPGEIIISGQTMHGWSVYSVGDNGIGIAGEHHAEIFEGFSHSASDPEGRQGVGLAIVRRIIERHQGTIEVDSTVGQGSTFRAYFPRAIIAEEEEGKEE
ncbi:MAG: HAMP domain-containing histidine kinase [Nitrospirales bacterium]|nr:HAMP domain-containing histidine kinase [Nitrospira sp.]MDR4460810.1 HAMP domain-containing histidine kinase [Nitrospirales bacterium]